MTKARGTRRVLPEDRYNPNPARLAPTIRRRVLFTPSTKATHKRDPFADHIEGAEWWYARSRLSADQLRAKFDVEDVGIWLLERVGAIVSEGRHSTEYFNIGIQIYEYEKDMDVLDICLTETGVFLEELYEPNH